MKEIILLNSIRSALLRIKRKNLDWLYWSKKQIKKLEAKSVAHSKLKWPAEGVRYENI